MRVQRMATSRVRGMPRGLVAAAAVLLALAAIAAATWQQTEVAERLAAAQNEVTRLGIALDRQRTLLDERQELQARLLEEIDRQTRADLNEQVRLALADEQARSERRYHALESRLASLQERLRADTTGRDEAAHRELGALRAEMESIRSGLVREIHDLPDRLRKPWPRIQRAASPALLLVHSEFHYRVAGERDLQTGHGWGTGFLVSAEGHVLTNKHVVHPWKFDPELCAMSALGDLEVLPHTLRLSAWRAGMRCLDEKRHIIKDEGYHSGASQTLRLLATAPDSMEQRSFEMGRSDFSYAIHALDDNDLAILKIRGPGTFPYLELPSDEQVAALTQLDPVMALGFPRGKNGLERGVAIASPSLGIVRKVERTIHVSAPIIPGNSGGPVFDERGRVVGIATRVFSETLGICIRIPHGRRLLDRVRGQGAPKEKARLGE